MTIRYEEHVPSPKEYCDMRVKAGLSPKSLKAAKLVYPIRCMAYLFGMRESSLQWVGLLVTGRVTSKLSTLPLILIIKVTV